MTRQYKFTRIGHIEIELIGVSLSGKISVLGRADDHEVWRVAPGKVYGGQGRPFHRTHARLMLVKITLNTADVVEECRPGSFWAARRREYLDKLIEIGGGEPASRAAFRSEG